MWVDLRRGILDLFEEAQRCGGQSGDGWIYFYHRVNPMGFHRYAGKSSGPKPRCLKCSNLVVGHANKKNRAWWYCADHVDPRKRATRSPRTPYDK